MHRDVAIITKAGCPTPKCKGVTFSLNDGAARLAAHTGREHYKCDTCENRWSVPISRRG